LVEISAQLTLLGLGFGFRGRLRRGGLHWQQWDDQQQSYQRYEWVREIGEVFHRSCRWGKYRRPQVNGSHRVEPAQPSRWTRENNGRYSHYAAPICYLNCEE